MAATDAKAIPIKNAAYRVTFPILDADGDLVTGATALDSEVSIDAGTFADCTNEATEIATGSGVYFLDLTAAEMNGDTIAVIVKTTSAGAKTTALVMYTAARSINDLATPTNITAATGVVLSGVTHTGAVIPTVSVLTGHTAQTGDNFARIGATGSGLTSLASQASVTAVDDFVDTEIADIQARLPAALVGGRMDSNASAINNIATSAARLARSTQGIVTGTVGAASSTTSIVTSALDPAAAVIDQYKGRIVVFQWDTTTVNLRGQATDITANTAAGVLTVTALTTSPVSGDAFVIV